MARLTGLEPATPGVTGRYSNQLSYNRSTIRPDRISERGEGITQSRRRRQAASSEKFRFCRKSPGRMGMRGHANSVFSHILK